MERVTTQGAGLPLETTRSLFVSPHMDDVALSCGGIVAQEVAKGSDPVVVTVFAGAPDPAHHRLTASAREFHAEIQLPDATAAQVVAMRREEDAAAMRALGTRHLWLDHHDAAYRDGAYATFEDLCAGPVSAGDRALTRELPDQLLALWRRTAAADVYLPLAIGHHVDHRICFAAGDALRRAGAAVRYYEDYPYVVWAADAVRGRLGELGIALEPRSVDVTAHLPQRIAAIECYASQLRLLFEAHDVGERIRAFAAGIDPAAGTWIERTWSS